MLLVVHLLVAVEIRSTYELGKVVVESASHFAVARQIYNEIAFGLSESKQVGRALVSHKLSAEDEALPTHSLSDVLSCLLRTRELVVEEDFSQVVVINRERVCLNLVKVEHVTQCATDSLGGSVSFALVIPAGGEGFIQGVVVILESGKAIHLEEGKRELARRRGESGIE